MKYWRAILVTTFVPVALAIFFRRAGSLAVELTRSGMAARDGFFLWFLSYLIIGILVLFFFYQVVRGFRQKDSSIRRYFFIGAAANLVLLGVFGAYDFKLRRDAESRSCAQPLLRLLLLQAEDPRGQSEELGPLIEKIRKEKCTEDWRFSVSPPSGDGNFQGTGQNDGTRRAWRMTRSSDGKTALEDISSQVYP